MDGDFHSCLEVLLILWVSSFFLRIEMGADFYSRIFGCIERIISLWHYIMGIRRNWLTNKNYENETDRNYKKWETHFSSIYYLFRRS